MAVAAEPAPAPVNRCTFRVPLRGTLSYKPGLARNDPAWRPRPDPLVLCRFWRNDRQD